MLEEEDVKEEESEHARLIKGLVKDWNVFIDSLLTAEKVWNKFVETTAVVDKNLIQQLTPPNFQKMLGLYGREKFTVALPRMVDYWRGYGGLEKLLIEEEKED